MKKCKPLVVISIPLIRIAKVSLSHVIMSTLREHGDVLIVSPFAGEENFRNDFRGKNTFFLKSHTDNISSIKKNLLNIPEFMRRLGYLRKFKNSGLMYYFKNQYTNLGNEGEDSKFGILRRLVYWVLGMIGQNKPAWKVTEYIFGSDWYQFPELLEFTGRYENVTLIQSANWGLQDRILARLSLDKKWRKVLLPYTTDQLLANGFLLNDFDAVCVQGELEFSQAKKIHSVDEKSIFYLGSAWFRHMEYIVSNRLDKTIGKCDFILYAGLSNTYFPSKSEFIALDALIEFAYNYHHGLHVVYRPVIFDKELKYFVEKKYGHLDILTIQWPAISVIGLDKYSEMNQVNSLKEYIDEMSGCKLLVMSRTTSYCMDVAFQEGCGVISNMIDSNKVLEKRHNHLFPTHIYPSLKIAHDVDGLIKHAHDLLDNPDDAKKQSKEVISLWDYPESDFNHILVSAVYGEKEKDHG